MMQSRTRRPLPQGLFLYPSPACGGGQGGGDQASRRNSVKQLRCRECGRLRGFEPAYVCEHCFGPLEVAYDLAAVRQRVSRESIAKGPNTMWRYRELLPAPTGEPIDLGTGFTPLVKAPNLGKVLGLDHLYLKNDTLNPTGSFKDRNVAVATNFAHAYGFDTLSCSSTGNLAGSVAAYAARAGLRALVFIPAGPLLAKTAKAFQELVGVGLLDRASTRIHAAQAEGCAPVSTAIQHGRDHVTPVRPNSIAKSLAIGNPADGRYAARAVRASGGWGTACREDAVQEGMALLAQTEGILSEPAGGVVVAGLAELVTSGRIRREETVVICITGSGLKTTELFEVRDGHRLQLARARAADFEQALAAAEKAPAVVA